MYRTKSWWLQLLNKLCSQEVVESPICVFLCYHWICLFHSITRYKHPRSTGGPEMPTSWHPSGGFTVYLIISFREAMESKLKKKVVISNIYICFGIAGKSSLPVTDSYIYFRTCIHWQILLSIITATSNKLQYISNHLPMNCLFKSLFKLTSKGTPMFHITGPSWEESTGSFPHKGPVMLKVFIYYDVIMQITHFPRNVQ